MSAILTEKRRRGKMLNVVINEKNTEQEPKRKSLQTLQQSAEDQNVLVGSTGKRVEQKQKGGKAASKKVSSKTKTTLRDSQKENAPDMGKHSVQKVVKTIVPDIGIASKSVKVEKKIQKKKSKATKKTQKCNSPDTETCDIIKNLPEVSSNCEIKKENISVTSALSEEGEYWKKIAEETDIELTRALERNDSLHTQREVLDADNAEITSILDKAEELAKYLKIFVNSDELAIDENSEFARSDIRENDLAEIAQSIISRDVKKEENSLILRRSKRNAALTSLKEGNLPNTSNLSGLSKNKTNCNVKNSKSKTSKKTSGKKRPSNSNNSAKCTDHIKNLSFKTNESTLSEDEYYMLMSDTNSEKYWRFVVEQKQSSLETTLHENELIQDQLIVLEAENTKLNSLLKEAKALAEIISDILV